MTERGDHGDSGDSYVGIPITDVRKANLALQDMYMGAVNGNCVVARGRVRLPDIMPGFALVVHQIYPDPDLKDGNDIVNMGGKGKMYSASFLREVAEVACVRTLATKRTDDASDPFLRGFEVVVGGMDLLLRNRQSIGRYELDLRDGSPRIEALDANGNIRDKAKARRDAREHIESKAATGAFCRAVVELLALPRSNKKTKIEGVPLYIPNLEMHAASAPPEVRAAMAIGAIQAVMGAFGPMARQAPQLPAPNSAPALGPPAAAEEVPPNDEWGDEPPFVEPDPEPEYDLPPDDSAVDSPITDQQKQQLNELGCWKQSVLKELGWPGQGKVTQAIYHAAMKEYGGAQ